MKILITGANTGIGFATAEQLVKQGQHVILACRNPQKALEAQNKLRSLNQGQVDVASLDLNSLELTQKAAEENGISFIDFDSKVPKNLEYFLDSVHYTEKGNVLIASILFNYLKEKHLIE